MGYAPPIPRRALLLPLLLLLAQPACALAPVWGQGGSNAQGTGVSALPGPTSAALKWATVTGDTFPGFENMSARADSGVNGVVVDSAGDVYFGSTDGNLYAVNGVTGAIKWTFQAFGGDRFNWAPAIGYDTATSVETAIYIGSCCTNNSLYALNITDGALLWSHSSSYMGSPIVSPQTGVVFVPSGWNMLAFSPSGSLLWTNSDCQQYYGLSIPSLTSDGVLLLFTCSGSGGGVNVVFSATGVSYKVMAVGSGDATYANRPTVRTDDSVVINVYDPFGSFYIYGYNTVQSTTPDWNHHFSPCYDLNSGTVTVDADGDIYVSSCNSMQKLARDGSSVLWTAGTPGVYCGPPSVSSNGLLYAVCSVNEYTYGPATLQAWNISTGDPVFIFNTTSYGVLYSVDTSFAPAIGVDGTVFATTIGELRGGGGSCSQHFIRRFRHNLTNSLPPPQQLTRDR